MSDPFRAKRQNCWMTKETKTKFDFKKMFVRAFIQGRERIIFSDKNKPSEKPSKNMIFS